MDAFRERLDARYAALNSMVCVGLDPAAEQMPSCVNTRPRPLEYFIEGIIRETAPYALVYKPNLAFFEALGAEGREVLSRLRSMVPADIPVILDAKSSDIGNTASRYAQAFFEELQVDAVTLNPYMGRDAVVPFLEYKERHAFVLCMTSNPGAADFEFSLMEDGRPLYMKVADAIHAWNKEYGNCGAVIGATQGSRLLDVRSAMPEEYFLVPGIGAQGGDLEAVLQALMIPGKPLLINSSRGILYASGGEDFAMAAGEAASALAGAIRSAV